MYLDAVGTQTEKDIAILEKEWQEGAKLYQQYKVQIGDGDGDGDGDGGDIVCGDGDADMIGDGDGSHDEPICCCLGEAMITRLVLSRC